MKLRVAWFSPLNCSGALSSQEVPSPSSASRSPAAYLSDLLLPHLREKFDLELFHSSFQRYQDFPTHHYLNAFKRHQQQPFDLFLYHLEDHAMTNFVRCHLGLIPGIVYFHDYLLSTYGPEPILNSPYRSVIDKFEDRSIPWPARDGEFERGGPFAYRESAYSPVSIFSTERNFGEWKRNHERSIGERFSDSVYRSFYLPYPVRERIKEYGTVTNYSRVLYCGSPRIEHRAHLLLEALRHAGECELVWLIDSEERCQVEALLEEFAVPSVVLVEGRSPARWGELLAQGGTCVHTLFSVFGQVTPYLNMSLLAGRPCIVTNFGGAEYLPDSVVFKIQPGETEGRELSAVLQALTNEKSRFDPSFQITYAQELFSSEAIASELSQILENSAPFLAKVMAEWERFSEEARSDLLRDSQAFAQRNQMWNSVSVFENSVAPIFDELGWFKQREANR